MKFDALILLTMVYLAGCAESVLNLRLKSGSRRGDLSSTSRTTANDSSSMHAKARISHQKTSRLLDGKVVNLDLSGRYECYVLGPDQREQEEGRAARDVIPLLRTNKSPFSIILGTDVDFSKLSFQPIKRLLMTIQWKPAEKGQDFTSVRSILSPIKVQLVSEWGLVSTANELAGEISIVWSEHRRTTLQSRNPGLSIKARIRNSGERTLSLFIPLHRRFLWQWNVANRRSTVSYNGDGGDRFDVTNLRIDPEWWVPNFTVNALGLMKSYNKVCFPLRVGDVTRLCSLRITARRRIEWGLPGLGWPNDESEPMTLVRIELESIDPTSRAVITGRIESQLEHIVDSTCVAIIQDVVR